MKQSPNLKKYRAKRDFSRTVEPRGASKKQTGRNSFVVQKHAARRLHFDFRLELDGVLLSWALTRGPSADPQVKRLAVRTEDHPIEYGRFEGTIPKGEYGGGTVMLWDRGLWSPLEDPRKGLAAGVLKFDLDGERLRGGYTLVRLPAKDSEKRENWLLIKRRDPDASKRMDPMKKWLNSVATGRTMGEIATNAKARAVRVVSRLASKVRKKPSLRLVHIPPQLATRAKSPPDGEHWLHEVKYDGYRIMAAVTRDGVKLFSRSGGDWTEKFQSIANALHKAFRKDVYLDGEVVVLGAHGRSDFGELQRALKTGRGGFTYCVFDILNDGGEDIRRKPLCERKARLKKLMNVRSDTIRYSKHVIGHGAEVLFEGCRLGLEGIVSKKVDAPYRSGRDASWTKSKCIGRDEFVIVGYRPSDKSGRPFASLLLGEYENRRLRYRGRVGTGFDEKDAAAIFSQLVRYPVRVPSVDGVPAVIARDAKWVEPRLVAELAYTERTSDGVLRHPVFLGLRSDKRARDVEAQGETSPSPSKSKSRPVTLSHPDKILFPEAKLTKRDLAQFFSAAAPLILPHIGGRPLSLVRCPDGTGHKCFFQKHDMRGFPDAFHRVALSESDGERATYLTIDDAAGLAAAAQMAAIELHVWGSHARTLEKPDRLVIDLDPDTSVTFATVRSAAEFLRKRLARLGLESFPLATGGKGIHLVMPLARRHSWLEVKQFAEAFARHIADEYPNRFTASMTKARRKGRIFIDWLRNERGSTAIAPYSPRAKGRGSVAMPVSWAELKRLDRSDHFDIPSAMKRIARKRDPWPRYFDVRQSIPKAMSRANYRAT